MEKSFFSSKEAATLTECTLRQLQYWRENEVVVPIVGATGTGKSIYYSYRELIELTSMRYLLFVGLSFDVARNILRSLKDKVPEYANPDIKARLMLILDTDSGILDLVKFDREQAIAFLDNGQPIIPLWLDLIHQKLQQQLSKKDSIMSNK
ncbi:MAG: MerR family transcriptional regulator [Snowella sp.]|nr:MerR family transcriptional regulator [Snowella sp.]